VHSPVPRLSRPVRSLRAALVHGPSQPELPGMELVQPAASTKSRLCLSRPGQGWAPQAALVTVQRQA
jgi:hypothetical protein